MVQYESRLLPMCVQGHIVFWPGSVMNHPIEMVHALPLERCVHFMSEHLSEEVRHSKMKTSCDFDLSV